MNTIILLVNNAKKFPNWFKLTQPPCGQVEHCPWWLGRCYKQWWPCFHSFCCLWWQARPWVRGASSTSPLLSQTMRPSTAWLTPWTPPWPPSRTLPEAPPTAHFQALITSTTRVGRYDSLIGLIQNSWSHSLKQRTFWLFLFQDYGEEQPEDVITGSGNGDFDYNFEDYPFEYGDTGGGEQDPDDLENLPGTGHAVLKVLF